MSTQEILCLIAGVFCGTMAAPIRAIFCRLTGLRERRWQRLDSAIFTERLARAVDDLCTHASQHRQEMGNQARAALAEQQRTNEKLEAIANEMRRRQ